MKARILITPVMFGLLLLQFAAGTKTPARNEAMSQLSPYKAIMRDKVRNASLRHDFGYTVATEEGNSLLVVFFLGATTGSKVSVADLNWTVKKSKEEKISSIGLCIPNPRHPMQIVGSLTEGHIEKIIGGKQPLFGLVFIFPRSVDTVTLLDPKGKEHQLQISKEWLPTEENYVYSFSISGAISGGSEGSGWKSIRD
jgi:hypothetical protein